MTKKVTTMPAEYSATLETLERLRAESMAAGDAKKIDAQHGKGKLSARERIDLLLDEGSFEEFDVLKTGRGGALGGERSYPGDGVVTGHGAIDGREVFVFSQDFTVVGGSLGEAHAQKICKVMDLAVKVGAPIIGLNDSGGARIQEGVDALAAYGEIFHRNVRASGVVPQVSCIMGPCAGGAVYSPAITDFVFMVQESSYMFVTGPSVVKTVTHQDITAEDLGGARVHSHTSGVSHFTTLNDVLCLREVRRLISYLPSNNRQRAPLLDLRDPAGRIDPALDYLIPENPNQTYDMNVLIFSILDGAEFMEVQSGFARNIICGFGRLGGRPSGWWPTSRRCWPAFWTPTLHTRPVVSCASATPSTFPWSPWWTFRASCPAPTRSTAASSATAPNCSTPSPRPRSRAFPSSSARLTAAPTW